ncbi:MAG: DNA gyrase subunit A [Clostridiales bacterium]|nr:DNA gyrase subunit A [Clostridiales bacterium]
MENENIIEEKIVPVTLESEMQKSYIDYAMSVIVARALPDVRDGLKPVHRRILYSMNELGLEPDKPFRKSARIVGDVLGKYHPHGDASVYDAMVRLAQDFSLRYMLVDGHGNFGSVDGDPPAAMRYTEARMTKLTREMLRDIDKETVDYVPNFDDTLKEPSVLPSRFPNMLVNGSQGIAVGMATNIPPHNLGEVIDGIIKVIDEDNVTIEDLMQVIKGPDFPTAGIIMGKDGIRSAYTTGRGRIIVRARAEIEENGSKQRIIVTELPYMVNKARLIENIANLVKDKRIEGISNLRDESDREGMRIVIELKRDANANVVLNQLYKNTQMQDTFGAIILALVNGQPQVLNLRQCIDHYLDHQKDVLLRRTRFDLNKAEARLHILEGLKIALDYIDEVIKIIRSAYDDAKEKLMARFNLTEIQAQAILDMRLRTLSGLQREKIEAEYNELVERIAYYKEILSSETLVYQIIKDELLEIKHKFADERRTAIELAADDIEIEDLIADEDCVVTMTHYGYIKRLPADTYKSQKRGGKGITGLTTRENDFVEDIFTVSTHDYILFFTNKGKTYRLKAYEIPEAGRQAKGMAIVNLLQLGPDEKVTAGIQIKQYTDDAYLLMATKKGIIKKTNLMEYNNVRKSGLQGITLRDDDELIDVRLTDGSNKVVIVTNQGQSITFDEKDVRPIGRVSQGVRGIELNEGDFVIGMEPIISNDKCLLAISENGFGKRTELEEYRVQTRGGKGVLTYKVTEKTGTLIGIKVVSETDDILMISSDGTIIRIPVKDISILGRNTQGVTLMRMPEDTKLVSITVVSEEEEEKE